MTEKRLPAYQSTKSAIPGAAAGNPSLTQTPQIDLAAAFQFVGVLFIGIAAESTQWAQINIGSAKTNIQSKAMRGRPSAPPIAFPNADTPD